MILLYRLSLFFYKYLATVAALFDPKAKQFVEGQSGLLTKIESAQIAKHNPVWFHCASLGEFEQARDLIDSLKESGEKILLTFFSPSGYAHRKNYKNADWVFFLPFDCKKNAQAFLSFTNPKVAIFVKYDLWYFYIDGLVKHRIPKYLISAIYRPKQIYFKPILGRLHRVMLGSFDKIFVQDSNSFELLKKHDINQVTITGDTRVDSVLARAKNASPRPVVEKFLKGSKAIIVGSGYVEEIRMLAPILNELEHEFFIIAPHEVNEQNVKKIQIELNKESIRYTELENGKTSDATILIIDNIGTLFHCYPYGKWAFIGGGYGNGIHNTLEPAAFGLPICFGPKYQSFSEAVEMVKNRAAFVIPNSTVLKELYLQLQNKSEQNRIENLQKNYLEKSKGAGNIIEKEILQKTLNS